MSASENPAIISTWVSKVEPEVVQNLSYNFAKRHGLVAICESDNEIDLIYVKNPDLQLYTELKRKLPKKLRLNQISQSGFEHILRVAYDKGQSEATQMVDDLDA